MNDSICDNLDDFLTGDLTSTQAEEFRLHLAVCSDCSCAVSFDRELSIALKAGVESLEPCPESLLNLQLPSTIHRSPESERPSRKYMLGTMAAALVVLLTAVGVRLAGQKAESSSDDQLLSRQETTIEGSDQKPTAPEAASPEVIVHGDVISVAAESSDPNVTVVFVYPIAAGIRD